jgi:hypothetical protein
MTTQSKNSTIRTEALHEKQLQVTTSVYERRNHHTMTSAYEEKHHHANIRRLQATAPIYNDSKKQHQQKNDVTKKGRVLRRLLQKKKYKKKIN